MSQESPTSLDKQLGSYPRPCEESQQLAPMRASRGLPCSLRSSPDLRDEPQACPGQARMDGVLTESGNRETVSRSQWEHRLWNPADPDVTNARVCWVTWEKYFVSLSLSCLTCKIMLIILKLSMNYDTKIIIPLIIAFSTGHRGQL